MSKIDVAVDLKGGFIPGDRELAFQMIKQLLQAAVESIFTNIHTNFLSLNTVSGLSVTSGDNILDTCLQYCVMGDKGSKLLNVKFYDKILDLISREGCHQVGSRTHEVLGSKRQLNVFNKRIGQARNTGMTRLELSICLEALREYSPWETSVKTLWHSKVQSALDLIVNLVMND